MNLTDSEKKWLRQGFNKPRWNNFGPPGIQSFAKRILQGANNNQEAYETFIRDTNTLNQWKEWYNTEGPGRIDDLVDRLSTTYIHEHTPDPDELANAMKRTKLSKMIGIPLSMPQKAKKLPCNRPSKSYKPEKKRMVRACANGKEKLIHFGATGYKHNYSPQARANFRARHRCDTAKDKLTARYWACKNLWTKGGDKLTKADKSRRAPNDRRRKSTKKRRKSTKKRRKSTKKRRKSTKKRRKSTKKRRKSTKKRRKSTKKKRKSTKKKRKSTKKRR